MRIVDVVLFNALSKCHIHNVKLRTRCTADLMLCKKWNGTDLYIEQINDEDIVVYVGYYGNITIHPYEVAEALHMSISRTYKPVQDDTWEPILPEDLQCTCTALQVKDVLLCPVVVPDKVEEVPANPIVTMLTGQTQEQKVVSTRTVMYEGKNKSDSFYAEVEVALGISNLFYKERNGIRFYLKMDYSTSSYGVVIVGPGVIPATHQRFSEWIDMLGIKCSQEIVKQMEDLRNGQSNV